MGRPAKAGYAATVVPLLAIDHETLTTPDLMEHLDALRSECARIFSLKRDKAEAGEAYDKEADAVADLSQRYCEAFAHAENRLGIGRTVGHLDLSKPEERREALRQAGHDGDGP